MINTLKLLMSVSLGIAVVGGPSLHALDIMSWPVPQKTKEVRYDQSLRNMGQLEQAEKEQMIEDNSAMYNRRRLVKKADPATIGYKAKEALSLRFGCGNKDADKAADCVDRAKGGLYAKCSAHMSDKEFGQCMKDNHYRDYRKGRWLKKIAQGSTENHQLQNLSSDTEARRYR